MDQVEGYPRRGFMCQLLQQRKVVALQQTVRRVRLAKEFDGGLVQIQENSRHRLV